MKIELGSHTDARGGDAANQRLAQRRADSARAWLLNKGIASNRITAVGYGEAQPIANNNSLTGRELNRRVEFNLVPK